VAFIDFDQEFLAARYQAPEDALILLARAARIVGGRKRDGLIVVQTRQPEHDVIAAAVHGDPDRFYEAEQVRRSAMMWPPYSALARVSGKHAEGFVAKLDGVDVLGPVDDVYLVRAPDHQGLCDALAAVPRPSGVGLRVEVDPHRV
jgi:primosomal protein N' (replication factor Y)